jgi:hypothetical protein
MQPLTVGELLEIIRQNKIPKDCLIVVSDGEGNNTQPSYGFGYEIEENDRTGEPFSDKPVLHLYGG